MAQRRLDRRTFLRGAAGGGAVLAAGGMPGLSAGRPGPAGKRPGLARGGRFRQGVASGDPRPGSARLWTRVEGIERPAYIELEVARDAGFARVVERRRVLAGPNRDFAVHARVKGLDPGERYFYRFDTGRRSSEVGQFRTLPPRSSRRPVRIGIFSCQDWEAGFYTAHAGLAAEQDLDLVVCLGDYVYERSFYRDEGAREDNLGANGDGEVQTLAEYRQKYSLYHSDANLRAVRASFPLLGIWDDHEVEDNYAGKLAGDATIDPRAEFIRRRRNAYRAYFEHMPFAAADGRRRVNRRGRRRSYQGLRLGRNAELILLDERGYRDDQPCGDELPPVPPCPEAERNDPSRTLLGAKQKRWLKRRLRSSDATWKLLGNQVMAMAVDVPLGNPLNMDQWDGYGAERAELCDFITAHGIEDVSLLTGDIHTFIAGVVTRTGRQAPAAGPAAVATEFVAGSMTSLGIPETVNGTSGVPLPPEIVTIVSDEGGFRANNPHYAYTNVRKRGYGVVEARPGELLVTFRQVATTMAETSAVTDLQRFRVARGTPAIELL